MRHFLLFLSSLIFSISSISAQDIENSDIPNEDAARDVYSFQIDTPKAAITGIMILKESGEDIVGSMVNEFGVSAIDFVYNKRKNSIKLLNVASFLNKWYIKLILKKDLRLAIQLLKDIPHKNPGNYTIDKTEDSLTLFNVKRKLKYTFGSMETEGTIYDTE